MAAWLALACALAITAIAPASAPKRGKTYSGLTSERIATSFKVAAR